MISVRTPTLCPGCRRLFIDFSKIPTPTARRPTTPAGTPSTGWRRRTSRYTVDPIAHSPNTKNFTNDKLLAPSGSPQEQLIGALDLHLASGYVTDTVNFVHTAVQGPYYIGPWYLNRGGPPDRRRVPRRRRRRRDRSTPTAPAERRSATAPASTGQTCPNDDDSFYAGCVDWWALQRLDRQPVRQLR